MGRGGTRRLAHVGLALAGILAACGPDVPATAPGQPGEQPPGAPRGPDELENAVVNAAPGQIVGLVTHEDGRPLPGATVSVYGSVSAGGEPVAFNTTTSDNGTYAVELPNGDYSIQAWMDVAYEGQDFRLALEATTPPEGGAYDISRFSEEGYRGDFVWRLTGLKSAARASEDNPAAHHGGALNMIVYDVYYVGTGMFEPPFEGEFPEGVTFEVTLTPIAPLIDGSQGEVLTLSSGLVTGNRGARWTSMDIPLGRYAIDAVAQKPDGTTHQLMLFQPAPNAGLPDASVDPAPLQEFVFEAKEGIDGGTDVSEVVLVYGPPFEL